MFWQTTDRGAIPGIAGRVDLNVYSGAQGDFARYANMRGSGAATRPVE
jgi:lysozyme